MSAVSFRCDLPLCNAELSPWQLAGTKVCWCTQCYAAVYCSRAHQIKHWKEAHKPACHVLPHQLREQFKGDKNLCIKATSALGGNLRELVARQRVDPGKVLLTQCKPFDVVSAPFHHKEGELDGSLLHAICELAQMLLTRDDLEEWCVFLLHHTLLAEAETTMANDPAMAFYLNQEALFQARLQTLGSEQWRPRHASWKDKFGVERMWRETCLVVVRNMVYRTEDAKVAAKLKRSPMPYIAIMLGVGLFNHSCVPTATFVVTKEGQSVVTQADIMPCVPLTVSYRPHITNYYPAAARQQQLVRENHMHCRCLYCTPDTREYNEREKLLQDGQTAANEDAMLEEFATVAAKVGMLGHDIGIFRYHDTDEVWGWARQAQAFMDKYQLSRWHWCANTLRQWMTRLLWFRLKQDREDHLEGSGRAAQKPRLALLRQWCAQNIQVNAKLLGKFAMDKNSEFVLFRGIVREQRSMTEVDRDRELATLDEHFGRWTTMWTAASQTENTIDQLMQAMGME